MKEIKLLIKVLKQYPDNWFVYPQVEYSREGVEDNVMELCATKYGLVVKTHDGEEKDFIELGDQDNFIL